MKAMNFRVDDLSIPMSLFKDHYVLVFDLTSMEAATKNCHYPETVKDSLRLRLNFTFPLEHVTEFFVSGVRTSLVADQKFDVVGKTWKFSVLDNVLLQQ